MGPLALPSNGPIYLDASAFIYSVELIEPYRALPGDSQGGGSSPSVSVKDAPCL